MYRIAIVVGGHADPVAALKPHIMCFSGPSVGLIRLIGSGANGRIWPAMMSAELPEGWA
jgi:hypothetical protein